MSVDIFSNPFTGSPQTWNAQGALITWASGQDSQAVVGGLTAALNTAVQSASNSTANVVTGTLGGDPIGSHPLACLTGLTIQYARQSSTQYPIGGSAPIKMLGAPSGQCSLTSLLGPTTDLQRFIKELGSGCNDSVIIAIKPFATQAACNGQTGKAPIILLHGCSMNVFGFQIQSQGQGISLVNIPLQIQFTYLTWDA